MVPGDRIAPRVYSDLACRWPHERVATTGTPRKGRGGRRPGAGRKPNSIKRLPLEPITAAEIIARRHPLSAALTVEELAELENVTKKLAEPSPDGSGNQKESNRATILPEA